MSWQDVATQFHLWEAVARLLKAVSLEAELPPVLIAGYGGELLQQMAAAPLMQHMSDLQLMLSDAVSDYPAPEEPDAAADGSSSGDAARSGGGGSSRQQGPSADLSSGSGEAAGPSAGPSRRSSIGSNSQH
jgi:hypothetical protein